MANEEGEQLEEGVQTKVPRADDTTKWYHRPYVWVLLVLLSFAVVAAIAVPVALSTRRDAVNEASSNSPTLSPTLFPTSSNSPTPALTPEQTACNFLQLTSLVECRATAKIPFCGFENLNSPNMSCSFGYYERPWGARTIPSEIGLLTQLTELVLSAFQLTGTIPSTLAKLTMLTQLTVSGSKLYGSIPSSLSRLSQLQQLDLSHNHLTGSIPSSLSRLTQLQYLDLNTNSLSGSIPSSLSNLTKLQSLNLAGNLLNGTIFPSLCSSVSFRLQIDCDEIVCDCCYDDFYGACPSGSPSSTPSPSAPTPTLTPEEIACNFLQLTSLTECRATAKIPYCGLEYLNSPNMSCGFDNYVPNGGRTIPSEIGLLTQLTELVLTAFQLTVQFRRPCQTSRC
ncbi:hypothetical protein MHU86_15264 [Fragilaria crotonensis]|nr:hypothetical protein MHU86_15264 [Fragilaria crotonensis]